MKRLTFTIQYIRVYVVCVSSACTYHIGCVWFSGQWCMGCVSLYVSYWICEFVRVILDVCGTVGSGVWDV